MQLEHQIGDRGFAMIEKRDRGGIAGKTTHSKIFAEGDAATVAGSVVCDRVQYNGLGSSTCYVSSAFESRSSPFCLTPQCVTVKHEWRVHSGEFPQLSAAF